MMQPKLFISGSHRMLPQVKELADKLQMRGMLILNDWWLKPFAGRCNSHFECGENYKWIKECDLFIHSYTAESVGGTWTELGMALALGKTILIMVRHRTTLYHQIQSLLLTPEAEDVVAACELFRDLQMSSERLKENFRNRKHH